ncbi:acyltransferase family protein (plasmid) [Streptomyces sp. BI20]|uniref:acyltransferase family protein n=1 Tax=Streptomyces sp. BI20 TaxID=3403460 RepID=UPI003C72529D
MTHAGNPPPVLPLPPVPHRPAALRRPYAPGLDGLRALAVTGVVVYHLNPAWLPGGFLGVDLFFVLSGFLITDLLRAEHQATGRVDLRGFWIRRARRLLPALALVLLTTTLVATLLRPERLAGTAGALVSTATFTNNWWQIAGDASYFAHFGPLPLFQHLWTLSVEEQFYLLWPLVLLALLALVRRPAGRAAIVAVLAAASVTAMACLHRPGADSSRVYFGTDTHVFPLLIGAALALALPTAGLLRHPRHPRLPRLPDLCGVIGLALAGALAWTAADDSDVLYPAGFVAAALCAAAVVASCTRPAGFMPSLLGASWLRWIGRRSYGIYLWHLPAIALATPDGRTAADAPLSALAATAVAVALAALSHRWVEEPLRRHGFRACARRSLHLLAGFGASPRRTAPVAVTACVLAAAVVTAGFGVATAPAGGDSAAERIELGRRALREDPGPSGPHADREAKAGGHKVTAIGDSVMIAAAPQLKQRFPEIAVDAEVGRQLSALVREVDALKSRGPLGDSLVIGLGTNGVGGEKDLQAAIDRVGPAERVVLVTVHVPDGWQDSVNRAIRRVAAKNSSHVAVADWDRAITGHDDLLAGDHTHPGPGGAKIYADTVAAALASLPPGA